MFGRFVGPQAAKARPIWAMLMRGRSFKAWSLIEILIPAYDILILSQSRHPAAPKLTCIELLISLHNDWN